MSNTRRTFLKSIGITATTAALAPRALGEKLCATQKTRPNIVFLFSDDHACHAISAYGSKINTTPNIDRLAAAGALFENSFVANAICGPSRACVMSGKHSHANGFKVNWGKQFPRKQPTFFSELHKSGYQTALVGKWHLGGSPKDFIGLDHWDIWTGGYYRPTFTSAKGRKATPGYSTDLIGDKIIDWIDTRDKTKPFVAMATFNAPHRTWAPAVRHLKKYRDADIPLPPTLHDDWQNRTPALAENRQSVRDHFYYSYDLKVEGDVPFATTRERKLKDRTIKKLTPAEAKIWDETIGAENRAFLANPPKGRALTEWKYQRYIKNYLRCVDAVDENVGKLLDYLKKNDLDKNTLVIYSSDQGFYLGDHGMYDKRWMFEESFKMPFIISWPGVIKPGSRPKEMIQNIDYAPLLIEAGGLNVPEEMQGKSFLPILKGKAIPWRNSVYYHYYEGGGEHNCTRHEGVRTDRYKLINFYDRDGLNLFDLKTDPQEMKNVVGDPAYAKVLVEMKAELAKLRKQYNVPPNVPRKKKRAPKKSTAKPKSK